MPNFTWTDNSDDPCPLELAWPWDGGSKPVGQRCIPHYHNGVRVTHVYKGLHADCKLRQAEELEALRNLEQAYEDEWGYDA